MTANKIRVLHLSTYNEECGIGKYQENFLKEMEKYKEVHNEFYRKSLNVIKKMGPDELKQELVFLSSYVQDFDLVHIQHEFGLFSGAGQGIHQLIQRVKAKDKPVIITIHTAPALMLSSDELTGYTPRKVAGYIKRRLKNERTKQKRLNPLKGADKIIALNRFTRDQLISVVGVDEKDVLLRMLPVLPLNKQKNQKIRKIMHASDRDVILCTAGFINENKGVDHAIKCLKLLPENYKLAVLGGINPDSGNPHIYNHITDLVIELGLEDRVHITGYIQDDDQLSEYIRGCDIALYPYNPDYYRMASSDAINKSLMNNIPVIAYPAESFKEINNHTPGAIYLTPSPVYYELVRAINSIDIEAQLARAEQYVTTNSYKSAAEDLVKIYKELLREQ